MSAEESRQAPERHGWRGSQWERAGEEEEQNGGDQGGCNDAKGKSTRTKKGLS